jgi:hypothetical protein
MALPEDFSHRKYTPGDGPLRILFATLVGLFCLFSKASTENNVRGD